MEGKELTYTSSEKYLTQERAALDKHEYFKGQIVGLAGASLRHNRIAANLIMEIGIRLKRQPCEVLPSDIRVCTPSREAYMYPDATIVCGKPEMEDGMFDTLKNPKIIFEILSPSTEDHDRRKKFSYYRKIPSFIEYVLIDSTKLFVEVATKQEDGSWQHDATMDPYGSLHLSCIGISIPLKEVYSNVF